MTNFFYSIILKCIHISLQFWTRMGLILNAIFRVAKICFPAKSNIFSSNILLIVYRYICILYIQRGKANFYLSATFHTIALELTSSCIFNLQIPFRTFSSYTIRISSILLSSIDCYPHHRLTNSVFSVIWSLVSSISFLNCKN